MTKRNKGLAMARLWELLKLLPHRPPGLTASEIQRKLEDAGFVVEKRTVERDLLTLSDVFPLQCNDKSKPYGWYWMQGKSGEIPSMSAGEALSWHMTEDLLRKLLPGAILSTLEPHFQHAHSKLQSLANEHNIVAQWKDKVRQVLPSLPSLPPHIDGDILETVQVALLKAKQLQVEYRAAHADGGSTLILHPLGLIQRGPVAYLAATAFDYEDIRLYALHRMQNAIPNDEPIRKTQDFDLDRYIADGALQFGGGEKIRLQAWVAPYLADYIREAPFSEDMTLEPEPDDEGFKLGATVTDGWQLKWWILSQGAGIVVTGPERLREDIRETLLESASAYQG